MYHVSTQGVDQRMINVHYYYCKCQELGKTNIIIIVNVKSWGKPKDVPEDAVTTPGPSGSGLEPSTSGLLSTPQPPPAHSTPVYIYICIYIYTHTHTHTAPFHWKERRSYALLNFSLCAPWYLWVFPSSSQHIIMTDKQCENYTVNTMITATDWQVNSDK